MINDVKNDEPTFQIPPPASPPNAASVDASTDDAAVAPTAEPAAPTISNGAVSPIARESPRMVPVMIPGKAEGKTWSRTTCHRVAPRANAAWRRDWGTARSASCVVMTMIGRISRLSVKTPAKSVGPSARPLMPKARTNRARPRMP